jgi:CDP-diglyceride synthetase
MITEITRKLSHIGICLLFLFVVPLQFFLGYNGGVFMEIVLVSTTFVIMLLLIQRNMLGFVTKVKRRSIGQFSIFAGLTCILILNYFLNATVFYLISVMILAFADTGAVLGGVITKLFTSSDVSSEKTIIGTVIFALISTLIILLIYFLYGLPYHNGLLYAVLISTITERVSKNGWDNLYIPIAAYSALMIVNI